MCMLPGSQLEGDERNEHKDKNHSCQLPMTTCANAGEREAGHQNRSDVAQSPNMAHEMNYWIVDAKVEGIHWARTEAQNMAYKMNYWIVDAEVELAPLGNNKRCNVSQGGGTSKAGGHPRRHPFPKLHRNEHKYKKQKVNFQWHPAPMRVDMMRAIKTGSDIAQSLNVICAERFAVSELAENVRSVIDVESSCVCK